MSALPFPDLGNLDDLDELLEESTRTVTAKTVSDLDDLDQLLTESTELAAAKRAKATGRKLSAEQSAFHHSDGERHFARYTAGADCNNLSDTLRMLVRKLKRVPRTEGKTENMRGFDSH